MEFNISCLGNYFIIIHGKHLIFQFLVIKSLSRKSLKKYHHNVFYLNKNLFFIKFFNFYEKP